MNRLRLSKDPVQRETQISALGDPSKYVLQPYPVSRLSRDPKVRQEQVDWLVSSGLADTAMVEKMMSDEPETPEGFEDFIVLRDRDSGNADGH